MDDATLRREVSELAFGYVMAGNLSKDWLSESFAPEMIPDRFREYDRLVDLHIALDPTVVDLAQSLREHLRSIKTETERRQHRSRDAIDGHIDWPRTYQERNNRGPNDRTLFITEQRTEAYDIPENLVLKKLLSIVYQAVTEMEDLDYEWVLTRWPESGSGSIEEFKQLFDRNVHLNRISTPEPPKPTARMVQSAKSSRKQFYRTAAERMEWRGRLLEGRRDAIESLFESGVIEPPIDRLFELFVVFQLLQALEKTVGRTGRVRPIEGGGDALAQVGQPPIYVYHESSADSENLRFPSMPTPEREDIESQTYQSQRTDSEWLKRSRAVAYWTEQVKSDLWGSTSSAHTGRPDAILVSPRSKDSTDSLEILIVEVKNSNSRKTINQGINELLRYIAYATTTATSPSTFLFPQSPDDGPFTPNVRGLLAVQDIELQASTEFVDLPVTIIEASDLETRLPKVLSRVFTSVTVN